VLNPSTRKRAAVPLSSASGLPRRWSRGYRIGRAGELHRGVGELLLATFAGVPLITPPSASIDVPMCAIRTSGWQPKRQAGRFPKGRQPAAGGFCGRRRSLRHAKRESRSLAVSWCICTYSWMPVLPPQRARAPSPCSCLCPHRALSAPAADESFRRSAGAGALFLWRPNATRGASRCLLTGG
jgi:hypothetical protein